MDMKKYEVMNNEKPLDNLLSGYSFTSIFRKIAFVGDSMSSGEFEEIDKNGNRHNYDMYDYSWGQFIARKNGLTAYNFSRGGMTAKEYIDSFAEANGFWDKEKACQAYVVALGANDIINQNMNPGNDEDMINYNTTTYIGAYSEIIRRYKEISPDAKFFLMTLPKDEKFGNEESYLTINKAINTLVTYFENTYIIDLYKFAPIFDAEFRKKYFLYGHMNAMGYIRIAEMVDSYIDYIIRNNMDDFFNVPFINFDNKANLL